MNQEGNSTASFGSTNNMTSSETTHVAMVGQTIGSNFTSSVEDSPAPSSESALRMATKRGTSRGRAQERSAHQSGRIPDQSLPRIPGSDGGSEGLGRGRTILAQSSHETQIVSRSRSPTPAPVPNGHPGSARSSAPGTPIPRTQSAKISGYSTPKSGAGRSQIIPPRKFLEQRHNWNIYLLKDFPQVRLPV
jgi:hypothetical protein